ncbi:MAG: HlyC/CorC family transporter [Lachnospiraceae bacterium]|nr:HlyC/CorC family transporter [Lachnospiraceae bacterium]
MKNKIFRRLGIYGEDNVERMEEEIISMVNEGHEQGVLHETEAEMITNIFEFGDKEAKDIMTNRSNIVAIDKNMPLEETLDYMLNEGKSRFPVYDENIDHIIGILHFRDAMRAHRTLENASLPVWKIEGLIRDAMFVPETKNIADLFRTMQKTKTQMVIVVGEYGQTLGLLAMEDILEEIVGNIMDEYDEEEAHIEETGNPDEYIIKGITRLDELEEKFGISFGEQEFETLNGFLISKMERIPEENEEFSMNVEGYGFRVMTVENRMIQSVLVTKLADPKDTEEML